MLITKKHLKCSRVMLSIRCFVSIIKIKSSNKWMRGEIQLFLFISFFSMETLEGCLLQIKIQSAARNKSITNREFLHKKKLVEKCSVLIKQKFIHWKTLDYHLKIVWVYYYDDYDQLVLAIYYLFSR